MPNVAHCVANFVGVSDESPILAQIRFVRPRRAAGCAAALDRRAEAQGASPTWHHGVSKFGDLKYPADFKQFDYVNPKAPKGGGASSIALGTFDNFNPAVAGVKGTLVFGIDLVFNTLTGVLAR